MILGDSVREALVLDLFAGSGALGIEALSRGARYAVFSDVDPVSLRALRRNVDRCGLADRARVVRARLPQDFPRLRKVLPGEADLVFMDPPYDMVGKEAVLEGLSRFSFLNERATIVLEHLRNEALGHLPGGFEIGEERRYGDTLLTFIRKRAGSSGDDDS